MEQSKKMSQKEKREPGIFSFKIVTKAKNDDIWCFIFGF